MPLDAPSFCLNRLTVGLFNRAYFRASKNAPEAQLVDWDTLFSILSTRFVTGTAFMEQMALHSISVPYRSPPRATVSWRFSTRFRSRAGGPSLPC